MTTKTVNGQTVNVYSVPELHQFIDQVLCFGRGVTPWEQTFMKDMQKRGFFSERQAEIIERIYAERTK